MPTAHESHRPRPAASGSPTATTVSVSPNPALYALPVTLSAAVSPAGATGSVTFYDGTAVLGSAPLSGGHASFTTALLAFGPNSIAARYCGDANNAPSLSPPVPAAVAVPPESGFAGAETYPTGPGPLAVVVADFNGDGFSDLATANSGGTTVSVLLGGGEGSFQLLGNTGSGNNPAALATADFNGDGKTDLAVANSGDDTVSILLGNGDGTFQSPVAYPVGSDPDAIAVGDFNADGWADVAVANFNDGTVSVLLGNGDGTFSSQVVFSVGSGPAALALADFNADGNADLAIANSGDGTVSILLGDGLGAFAAAPAIGAGLNPSGIVAADFNGDGKADLAVADYGDYVTLAGGAVVVLAGNGDGSFQSPVVSLAGTSPWMLAAGDLNGDGTLDLAVSGQGGISVLAGNGDGSFQSPAFYSTGSTPIGVALGPFDGSGLTDIASAAFEDNGVAILPANPGACSFALAPPSLLFDASGGTANLALTSNSPACLWSASGDSWILPGTPTGMGPAALGISVQANPNGIARQGTIGVGGQTVAISQTATAQVFADVPPQAYYFDAVDMLKQQGITAGCSLTNYCPGQLITRAQMAIFMVRAVYGSNPFTASSQPYFDDVPPGAFGFPWIQKMYELGITTGCGKRVFCPSNSVTRDQMAIFIVRTRFGAAANFTSPSVAFFADVPPTGFGFPWIQRMKQDAITTGCGTGLYCPHGSVSRGDMAIFIMRGAFNQLLPADTPVVAAISPPTLAPGASGTFTIIGANTNFIDGQTTIAPMPGVTVGALTVTAPTALTVQLTADPAAIAQPVSIVAITGSEQAVLPNGLLIQ